MNPLADPEVTMTPAEIKALVEERDKLLRFKTFVHARLDQAGVPTHPHGKHSKEGCRIGDRLDMLIEQAEDIFCLLREAGSHMPVSLVLTWDGNISIKGTTNNEGVLVYDFEYKTLSGAKRLLRDLIATAKTLPLIGRSPEEDAEPDQLPQPAAVEGKYGVITASKKAFRRNEPVFLIRATDRNAMEAVMGYATLCIKDSCATEHVIAAVQHAVRIRSWQAKNPELVKKPD